MDSRVGYFLRRDFLRSAKIGALFGLATVLVYVLREEPPWIHVPFMATANVLVFVVLVAVGRSLGWWVYTSTRQGRDLATVYEEFLRDTAVWK